MGKKISTFIGDSTYTRAPPTHRSPLRSNYQQIVSKISPLLCPISFPNRVATLGSKESSQVGWHQDPSERDSVLLLWKCCRKENHFRQAVAAGFPWRSHHKVECLSTKGSPESTSGRIRVPSAEVMLANVITWRYKQTWFISHKYRGGKLYCSAQSMRDTSWPRTKSVGSACVQHWPLFEAMQCTSK